MVRGNDPEQSFKNIAGSSSLLTKLSSLQMLKAEGSFVEHVFGAGELSQLIYLHCDSCPSSLPFSIAIKTLRVLYLEGRNLETLWQEVSEVVIFLTQIRYFVFLFKL